MNHYSFPHSEKKSEQSERKKLTIFFKFQISFYKKKRKEMPIVTFIILCYYF